MLVPPLAPRAGRTAFAALAALAVLLSGCVILPDRHGSQALASERRLVGVWLGGWPSDREPLLEDFERATGVEPDLVDVYLDWHTPFANVTHTATHIARHGAIPILTWEPQGLTTRDLLAGTKVVPQRDGSRPTVDAYLASFADGTCRLAAQTGQPVFIRTLHEMNGNWFSWGQSYEKDGKRPNTDESYRQAWVKIHDAFTGRCGGDVRFVWAINHFSKNEGATFMGTYPGDAYVDYVGIDGYNWGASTKWGWQDFDTIFREPYCAVTKVTSKPILLAEVASSGRGGDKAEWIRTLYEKMDEYRQMRGFVWFNDAKYEIEVRGGMDWTLDGNAAATQAFADGARRLADDGAAVPQGPGPVC